MKENMVNLKEIDTMHNWKSNKRYAIALLSWTMGLNNIIQIPELFLKGNILDYVITYIPMVILIGIPLTFMELSISQYSKRSLKLWDLCPLFRGIGYSKVLLIYIFQIHYNAVNSYMLLYAVTAFSKSTRWSTCDASWANSSCYNYKPNDTLRRRNNYQSSTEQFWFNGVLSYNEDFNFLGAPAWEPTLYLCITMFIVFLVNSKGTKFLRYILPYTMLVSSMGILILTFAIMITPGSIAGLNYIFKMEIHPDILLPWRKNSMSLDAFRNTLFSMGLGLGGLSTLAAQSSFRNPVCAYAILLNLVNIGQTIIYAIIIFGFYGIFNRYKKIGIREIVHINPKFENKVFTVIPDAILRLPGPPQIWIFIFYFCMFLKGLSCSALLVHTILKGICETKPKVMKKSTITAFISSLIIYLPGIILYTNVGILISTYFREITYTTLLPLINWAQINAIIYFYGFVNFADDLHFMLGYQLTIYWKFGLFGSSILLPIFTTISIITFTEEFNYYKFSFMKILHNIVLLIILFWIPFMALMRIIRKGIWKNALALSKCSTLHLLEVIRSRDIFASNNLTYEYIYERNVLNNKLKRYEN